MRRDIATHEDIVLLVDTFYGEVLADKSLLPFFEGIDFEHHKPRMIHFWSFVLLDAEGYTTNVFDKHAHLPIRDEHFDRWLFLFEKTVTELFDGEKANSAIQRAKTIGWTFKEKFKRMHNDNSKL